MFLTGAVVSIVSNWPIAVICVGARYLSKSWSNELWTRSLSQALPSRRSECSTGQHCERRIGEGVEIGCYGRKEMRLSSLRKESGNRRSSSRCG